MGDLTMHMRNLLSKRKDRDFGAEAWCHEIVQEIKERWCYISLDHDKELEMALHDSNFEREHKLPDGNCITLSSERFCCPEILFRPNLAGKQGHGIHEACFQAIMKCDPDLPPKRDLWENIVL